MAMITAKPGASIEVERATLRLTESGSLVCHHYDAFGEVWIDVETVDDDLLTIHLDETLSGKIDEAVIPRIREGQPIEITYAY